MSLRSRHPRIPGAFASFGLLALLGLGLFIGPAAAQVATIAPRLSPVDHMLYVRAGTYEVWQDTTRLGTEFYTTYMTAKRDSMISSSVITYELRSRNRRLRYEKQTLRITSAEDNSLYLYQAKELIGEQDRALSLTCHDTTATIYHEDSGKGEGAVVELPPGRVYVFDPSVYEQVEWLARDFAQGASSTRTMHAVIPARDTVIAVQVTRGSKEKIAGPGGKSMSAQRIDIFDDLTKIQVWLDDDGNLVRLEAPAQKVRVVRLPAGADEADALARAQGPANSSGTAVRR